MSEHDAENDALRVEHVGGCNPGCDGDDHLLLGDDPETPAGGHAPDDDAAVSVSGSEREAATVPPAGLSDLSRCTDRCVIPPGQSAALTLEERP